MLLELRVRNFLLIDSLDLSLGPGFNVMTGETGAGKSVIVGALQLVLGGRAGPHQIRPGAESAEIEALFELEPTDPGLETLRAGGLDNDPDLVVRRVRLPSSRARAYLNGRLCAVAELSQLAADLADIASQHESVSLTNVASHLGYLDAFGGLDGEREQIARRVTELTALRAEVARLQTLAQQRAERQEFLLFQLNAIQEVDPRPHEREQLQNERSRLRGATRLAEIAWNSAELLTGDQGVCDRLRGIVGDLATVADIDASLAENGSDIQIALDRLGECARGLKKIAETTHADPARLDEVEHRLYRLEGLLRRHGPTESDAMAAMERLRAELVSLEEVEESLRAVEKRFDQELSQAEQAAFSLSRKRTETASRLALGISEQLASLGMGGAQVRVEVARHAGEGDLMVKGARLTAEGVDRVEFLIAPNKGIEPRPLRKIASGGELSRALLAIKRVLASQGPAGLYIFDEVDAGVGGAVAERIGQALADIAKHHQVLCITHLAPIAALADYHFVVRKSQDGHVARTQVVPVTGEDRVREIARMLSGKNVTKASMQAATEMMQQRQR